MEKPFNIDKQALEEHNLLTKIWGEMKDIKAKINKLNYTLNEKRIEEEKIKKKFAYLSILSNDNPSKQWIDNCKKIVNECKYSFKIDEQYNEYIETGHNIFKFKFSLWDIKLSIYYEHYSFSNCDHIEENSLFNNIKIVIKDFSLLKKKQIKRLFENQIKEKNLVISIDVIINYIIDILEDINTESLDSEIYDYITSISEYTKSIINIEENEDNEIINDVLF